MFWDKVAGVYDIFVNIINRKTHRRLKEIVSDLVEPDDTVLECACGTGLEKCFSQVEKVLKPGGYFMICNESDGTDPTSLRFEKIIDGMKNYTSEEIEAALRAAGFSEVTSDHHPSKPWITVLARK